MFWVVFWDTPKLLGKVWIVSKLTLELRRKQNNYCRSDLVSRGNSFLSTQPRVTVSRGFSMQAVGRKTIPIAVIPTGISPFGCLSSGSQVASWHLCAGQCAAEGPANVWSSLLSASSSASWHSQLHSISWEKPGLCWVVLLCCWWWWWGSCSFTPLVSLLSGNQHVSNFPKLLSMLFLQDKSGLHYPKHGHRRSFTFYFPH